LDLKLAKRYLRSRRSSRLFSLITLIATGGVTVGVMALIVVMGVMNGLQTDLREKILGPTPHLRINTYGMGFRMDDWETARNSVLSHPDVVAAEPVVYSRGLIMRGYDFAEGPYVKGISSDTGTVSATALPRKFIEGDLSFRTTLDSVQGGIVLGRLLAERLSAYPGDSVTMISPTGSRFNPALGAFVPQYWTFEVTGHFETEMYEYDNNWVAIPLEVAQEYAGLGAAVSGIEVRLNDPWQAPRVGAELEEALGPRFNATDWQSQNASLFSALKLEKLAMFTILLLIVIVAAFNIVSTLTMVVRDKTREIGILRAMGLPAKVVRRTFILQGAFIGVVGTGLGTTLGLAVAWLVDSHRFIELNPSVYFIDHLPVRVAPLDLTVVIVASIAVATLATIYPARQAATLNPVDAIRYE
jgi:lipoprotein-releasing system permease protein